MSEVFINWLNKYEHNFGPFIDGECFQMYHRPDETAIGDLTSVNLQNSNVKNAAEYKEISVIINEDLIIKSIKSSESAFVVWKNNPKRGQILKNVCNVLQSKSELFAEISLATHGICKTYSIRNDLSYAIGAFSYYGNWYNKFQNSSNNWKSNGVVGCIFLDDSSPLMCLSWLTAPVLAAGNTIILLVKPHYSLVSLAFANSLSEAGIPPGVLNVIPCVDKESFPSIVDKLNRVMGVIPASFSSMSFSVHISSIMKKSSVGIIPMLILNSADISSAVQCIIDVVKFPPLVPWFLNLILVEEPVFDSFVSTLKEYINRFTDYHNEHESNLKYGKFINEKLNEGHEVIKLCKDYVRCLFLMNCDDAIKCPVIKDELHPPVNVISVVSVRYASEAVSLINNSASGLAASIWTNDSVNFLSIPFKLQYGTVWVNSFGVFDPAVTFSPWNKYGFGAVSGDKAALRSMNYLPSDVSNSKLTKYGLYPAGRNDVFPKKDVQEVVQAAYNSFLSIEKSNNNDYATFLDRTAAELERLWQSHYKIVLSETSEEVFRKAFSYVQYWASFNVLKEETLFIKDFCVMCKKEPVGVVCIVAGSAPLDVLVYFICAAIACRNTVVVGISVDQKSAVLAMELENMFSMITERIKVVVSDTAVLWDRFLSNENVSAVWYIQDCVKVLPEKVNNFKDVSVFHLTADMKIYSEAVEMKCTRRKAVWLPKVD